MKKEIVITTIRTIIVKMTCVTSTINQRPLHVHHILKISQFNVNDVGGSSFSSNSNSTSTWVGDKTETEINYINNSLGINEIFKMPGGTELNGRQIYDDGQREIDEIRGQMLSTYEMPPLDFIG